MPPGPTWATGCAICPPAPRRRSVRLAVRSVRCRRVRLVLPAVRSGHRLRRRRSGRLAVRSVRCLPVRPGRRVEQFVRRLRRLRSGLLGCAICPMPPGPTWATGCAICPPAPPPICPTGCAICPMPPGPTCATGCAICPPALRRRSVRLAVRSVRCRRLRSGRRAVRSVRPAAADLAYGLCDLSACRQPICPTGCAICPPAAADLAYWLCDLSACRLRSGRLAVRSVRLRRRSVRLAVRSVRPLPPIWPTGCAICPPAPPIWPTGCAIWPVFCGMAALAVPATIASTVHTTSNATIILSMLDLFTSITILQNARK